MEGADEDRTELRAFAFRGRYLVGLWMAVGGISHPATFGATTRSIGKLSFFAGSVAAGCTIRFSVRPRKWRHLDVGGAPLARKILFHGGVSRLSDQRVNAVAMAGRPDPSSVETHTTASVSLLVRAGPMPWLRQPKPIMRFFPARPQRRLHRSYRHTSGPR